MLREFAPAKINLYLHITGRRPDGYHILDSLVTFAGVGDEIRLEPAPRFDFITDGPQAALLKKEPVENNLVVRAARMLAERTGKPLDLRLTLIKNLPVASGIGGGSSDAAAALRLLGLTPPVDYAAIRARYIELVKLNHPDANGGDKASEERLKTINQALQILKAAYLA